jgi:hypothetical protein
MWAQDNQCEPDARARLNDCGPGRVLYYEPDAHCVRAATPSHQRDLVRLVVIQVSGMARVKPSAPASTLDVIHDVLCIIRLL